MEVSETTFRLPTWLAVERKECNPSWHLDMFLEVGLTRDHPGSPSSAQCRKMRGYRLHRSTNASETAVAMFCFRSASLFLLFGLTLEVVSLSIKRENDSLPRDKNHDCIECKFKLFFVVAWMYRCFTKSVCDDVSAIVVSVDVNCTTRCLDVCGHTDRWGQQTEE